MTTLSVARKYESKCSVTNVPWLRLHTTSCMILARVAHDTLISEVGHGCFTGRQRIPLMRLVAIVLSKRWLISLAKELIYWRGITRWVLPLKHGHKRRLCWMLCLDVAYRRARQTYSFLYSCRSADEAVLIFTCGYRMLFLWRVSSYVSVAPVLRNSILRSIGQVGILGLAEIWNEAD